MAKKDTKLKKKKTQKRYAVPAVLVNTCNVGRMPVSKKEKQLEAKKKKKNIIFLLSIFYMHGWGTHYYDNQIYIVEFMIINSGTALSRAVLQDIL